MKILFGIIVVGAFVFGGYLMMRVIGTENDTPSLGDQTGRNVSIVAGTQIIEITAKGGYLPRVSMAKAGIPTILRVNTAGTFDCSSALRIPSLKISEHLPVNGVTDIPLGTLMPGTMSGNCSMGMYPFQIVVEE